MRKSMRAISVRNLDASDKHSQEEGKQLLGQYDANKASVKFSDAHATQGESKNILFPTKKSGDGDIEARAGGNFAKSINDDTDQILSPNQIKLKDVVKNRKSVSFADKRENEVAKLIDQNDDSDRLSSTGKENGHIKLPKKQEFQLVMHA